MGLFSPLAQLAEHRSYEPKVTGSSPVGRKRAMFGGRQHDVKLHFASVPERLTGQT